MKEEESLELAIDKLQSWISASDAMTLTNEAEEVIQELYRLKKKIEAAEKKIKEKLIDEGLKTSPEFKEIRGIQVKINYHAYGAKYSIDLSKVHSLPKEFFREEKKLFPIAKAIDSYLAERNTLPEGIIGNERTKSIRISFPKDRSLSDSEDIGQIE